MKKNIYFLACIFCISAAAAGCGRNSAPAKLISSAEISRLASGEVSVPAGELQIREIDVAQSSIRWTGWNKISRAGHHGIVSVQSGTLSFRRGGLAGGEVTVDMQTITDEDLTRASSRERLETHLRSGDFFAVAEFPTASFRVTGIEPAISGESNAYQVTGELVIKGNVRLITVPVVLDYEGEKIIVRASFAIDRTEWGVNYASEKLFKGLGDQAIDDAIQFDVRLAVNGG